MSSPNACGCIALLLSGLSMYGQEKRCNMFSKVPCSPHRIRAALNNSCRYIDGVDALGQGNGLIQVWSHVLTIAIAPWVYCLLIM